MDGSLWERVFTEREVSEIRLALLYASQFNHGTSGHLSYRIIAKFAKLLEMLHEDAVNDIKHDEDQVKSYLTSIFGEK